MTKGSMFRSSPQSNWKVLLDRVIDGQLDGAHMLAGPADRCHDRFWDESSDHHCLFVGLQRKRHYRFE